MNSNHIKTATWLALGTAAISGVANFVNKIAVTGIKDPVFFTTLKNALVALILIGIIIAAKRWQEIVSLTKAQILKLLAIGAVGGSLPFALFFIGLSKTSAINASLIHKTLFIWVLLLAVPILKERVTKIQLLGIASIFAANLLVGGFTGFKYNIGELMILAATILWAIENIIAKVALRNISSLTVAAARMTVGSAILLPIAFWRGANFATIGSLEVNQWLTTAITVLLLLGYVITWYSALKRAPATYVATLLVPATLVTNILSAVFVTSAMNGMQILSSLLLIAGIALVVLFAKRVPVPAPENQPAPVEIS